MAVGGRTGLTAVTVGVLFLLALFLAPLANMVPSWPTAGALFYVAILMMSSWPRWTGADLTEAAPVAVVTLMMPMSFSIAHGIELGFIAYAAIKLLSGRHKDVSVSVPRRLESSLRYLNNQPRAGISPSSGTFNIALGIGDEHTTKDDLI